MMIRSDAFSADRSSPHVLAWSTFGTILSLARVWNSAAASFAPVVGA